MALSAGTRTASNVPTSLASNNEKVKFFGRNKYGEILIYKNALNDTERQTIESYLALKWGMSENLPSDHPGRTRPDGWLLGGDGDNGLSLNLDGAGAYQSGNNNTSSPSTDNQWHHVASTFDGSSRKLYLDGVEVSSVSTSGSISPTVAGLVLGAVDLNTTQPPAEEIKAVKITNHSKIKLDEARIYDTALSSAEVSELYNFGKGDLQRLEDFSTFPL